MRNITCIKLIAGPVAAFLLAGNVFAQSKPSGNWPLPQGCYSRNYSADHVAKHPKQVVKEISVRFHIWEGDPFAGIRLKTTNQGHMRQSGQGGQIFEEGSECILEPWPKGLGAKIGWVCLSSTNSGGIYLQRFDDDMLIFRTKGFVLGESESLLGVMDLAELPDKWVTYKLFRVDGAQCVYQEG